jgi:hypothetical protein
MVLSFDIRDITRLTISNDHTAGLALVVSPRPHRD